MKFEIKSRWDSKILFTAEAASLLLALEAAIKAGINLSGADLSGADLSGAKNSELVQAQTSILPEGNLVGWKMCRNNVVVKVLIPQKARRSNATGRKCRAEYVQVLQVFGAEEGISRHDGKTAYRKGEIVKCNNWDENRWAESSGGIHFFLTRIEAESY